MYPQTHFLFSFFIGSLFVKFGVFDYKVAFFVALVGLLVDIDHFIVYVFKYKEMNFKHAWNKAVKGLYAGRSFIHHQIGILLITLVIIFLYYFNRTFFLDFRVGILFASFCRLYAL